MVLGDAVIEPGGEHQQLAFLGGEGGDKGVFGAVLAQRGGDHPARRARVLEADRRRASLALDVEHAADLGIGVDVVAVEVVAAIDIAPELGHGQLEVFQVPELFVAVVVGGLEQEIDEFAESRVGVEPVAAAE